MTADRLAAADFTRSLRAHGVERVTGVPCGHLAGPWELFDRSGDLLAAADEGAALSVAAGNELAGRRTAVFCQNSGFGNLINPLTSLILPYRIPVLVVMTLRGWPDPGSDEPQHAVMGAATTSLLDALGVPYTVLQAIDGSPAAGLASALEAADAARADRRPFFLLVPRGAIAPAVSPVSSPPADPQALTRADVVAALMARLRDELLITTTGFLSRQAHHEADRPGTFYMQGSMGHAAAIGLGVAEARPERGVVVLDGDGAFLMHLGTGSTIAAAAPRHLIHVVVDNGCYESTGCQATTSGSVDWSALGLGLGYRQVVVCDRRPDLKQTLDKVLAGDGPLLCVFRTVPTPDEVYPRATSDASPVVFTDRFQAEAGAR